MSFLIYLVKRKIARASKRAKTFSLLEKKILFFLYPEVCLVYYDLQSFFKDFVKKMLYS